MTTPQIDFSLRPNKAIERKLIFEALAVMGGSFRWRDYQYVGFGALWFQDFILAHRFLRIGDMHSIEKRSDLAARAEVSKPLKCITVHHGPASKLLRSAELGIKEKKSVVWLDYFDTATSSTLDDLDRVCRDLPLGSVVIVTLNADPRKFSSSDTCREALKALFGEWVPTSPGASYYSRDLHEYPRRLSELVCGRALETSQRAGRDLAVLFNFAYADNAPMMTIGGMLVGDTEKRLVADSGVRECSGVLLTGDIDRSTGWPRLTEQNCIRVPLLTRLERLRLNRELPGTLSEAVVKDLCGDALTEQEREDYATYFRHYPAFAEIEL